MWVLEKYGPWAHQKKQEVKWSNKNTKIKTQYINTKLKHNIITYETKDKNKIKKKQLTMKHN